MFLWKLGRLKYNRNKIKIKKTVSVPALAIGQIVI